MSYNFGGGNNCSIKKEKGINGFMSHEHNRIRENSNVPGRELNVKSVSYKENRE